MDVILDSNVYLSDIRMESIRFQNLFDYLRRTSSSLVLPRIVREEVVARYKHQFELRSRKAAQAAEELNKLILDKHDRLDFDVTEPKYVIRDLRAKLRKPGKGVKLRYYPEIDGIDISDVYLRGINRRRPADTDGEELRDVILWLVVLQYAERSANEVAFVSNDNGFWEAENAHPHILEDIDKRNVRVRLFRTIEEFVRKMSPTPEPVTDVDLEGLIDVGSLTDAIEAMTKNSLEATSRERYAHGRPISPDSMHLVEAKFVRGDRYQVNPNTSFFEVEYALVAVAEDKDWPVSFEPAPLGPAPSTGLPSLYHQPSGPGSNPFIPGAPLQPLFGGLFTAPPGMAAVRRAVVTAYRVQGTAHISIRLAQDKPPEIELDRVEISDFRQVPMAEVPK
jgi:hypothetical protein